MAKSRGKKTVRRKKFVPRKQTKKTWRSQLEVRFRQIDKNGDGVIDFQEFRNSITLIIPSSKKLSDRDVVQLFKAFDRQGRGVISMYDFENVFAAFSKGSSSTQL